MSTAAHMLHSVFKRAVRDRVITFNPCEDTELRKVLVNTVPGERLQNFVLAIVEKAEKGDVAAAKLVFQYTVGKPIEEGCCHPAETTRGSARCDPLEVRRLAVTAVDCQGRRAPATHLPR